MEQAVIIGEASTIAIDSYSEFTQDHELVP